MLCWVFYNSKNATTDIRWGVSRAMGCIWYFACKCSRVFTLHFSSVACYGMWFSSEGKTVHDSEVDRPNKQSVGLVLDSLELRLSRRVFSNVNAIDPGQKFIVFRRIVFRAFSTGITLSKQVCFVISDGIMSGSRCRLFCKFSPDCFSE